MDRERELPPILFAGELHLTPLKGVFQLRPALTHITRADAGSKRVGVAGGGATSEGDTTESEGEEARPVQVKFACREVGSQRSVKCLRGHVGI